MEVGWMTTSHTAPLRDETNNNNTNKTLNATYTNYCARIPNHHTYQEAKPHQDTKTTTTTHPRQPEH